MKSITVLALTLGLASAPAAFAEQQPAQPKPAPQAMKMSDAQLDNVVAGQVDVTIVPGGLVNVSDVTVDARILNNSLNDVTVQVPVAANIGAAVAVLGNARSIAQQLGRQF
jgi:hypothetical protein